MNSENIFNCIPTELTEESFTSIHCSKNLRIERIVSRGHRSPDGFWYDQVEHEWVILLEGGASIQIEGCAEPVELQPGSHLNIPAHTRHRVVHTHPTKQTIWLAIHYTD